MKWFVFCTLVAGMILFAADGYAQRRICDESQTIVPGEAIGKLKLGATVEEAQQLLGKPGTPDRTGKAGRSEWRKLHYLPSSDVGVYAQDGKIVALLLGTGTNDTSKCRTSGGVGIGNRMAGRAKKVFGEPDGKYDVRVVVWWMYPKRGISLMLNSRGDILAVEIFAPGTYCAIADADKSIGWKEHVACPDFKPPRAK